MKWETLTLFNRFRGTTPKLGCEKERGGEDPLTVRGDLQTACRWKLCGVSAKQEATASHFFAAHLFARRREKPAEQIFNGHLEIECD